MDNSAAIEALERRLADLERKGNTLIEVINDLRAESGLPPRPPFGTGNSDGASPTVGGGTISSIRSDTFYGKKMQTAVREYLDMRRAAGIGPAKPRDIYDALVKGGFQSDAKDEQVALVGLRAMLRKRTNYFHKLPNGTYGLTAWYPNPKQTKTDESVSDTPNNNTDDGEAETEAADNTESAVA